MELICHQAPVYGNGTGANSVAGIYDELGCEFACATSHLWGTPARLLGSLQSTATERLLKIPA